METILITGGAGFIGSNLCRFFLAKNYKVIVVDNFITSLEEKIVDLKTDKRFNLIKHDISKPLKIDEKIQYVLHLASLASPVDYMKLPIQTLGVGAMGTHHALEIAKANQAIFLLASTSEVYGDPKTHPQPESYWGNVNPIGPRGVYDESKRYAESLTMAYHNVHQLDTKIVRIFNTFGPGMRKQDGRAVPNFVSQALNNEPITVYGEGQQTRSFCYIDDLIRGIYLLLQAKENTPINIGNPTEHTVLELAELIIKLTGSKSEVVLKPLPVDDPKTRCPDISKAKKVLDWQPGISIEEGLKKTIAWFKAN